MIDSAVVVINPVVGICHMRVCIRNGTDDATILREANRQNLAGTRYGWLRVVRDDEPMTRPVQCESEPTLRTHYLVAC